MKINPQIDDYIEKSQPFAKPIIIHLRQLVHQACPEVEEKIKNRVEKKKSKTLAKAKN